MTPAVGANTRGFRPVDVVAANADTLTGEENPAVKIVADRVGAAYLIIYDQSAVPVGIDRLHADASVANAIENVPDHERPTTDFDPGVLRDVIDVTIPDSNPRDSP